MLCCGLTTFVVIMINAIIPASSAPVKAVGNKTTESHIHHHQGENNSPQYFTGTTRSARITRKNKNRCYLVQGLDSILIKLRNVIDKYDLKQEELKMLYTEVSPCGLNNCGKFRDLSPKIKKLKCRKNKGTGSLNNRTISILLDFHEGVQDYVWQFQTLIKFEKSPDLEEKGISNGSRLGILKGFHTDVKTLNAEILGVAKKHKRLNFPRNTTTTRPISQTDLKINEWRIIQQSKDFLMKWKEHLERVFKCWKRRSKNLECGNGFKFKKS